MVQVQCFKEESKLETSFCQLFPNLKHHLFRFIQKRASGGIWTLAHWMRQFVMRHPEYKKDSVVNEEICYDLVKTMDDIAQGRAHCPCLLGNFRTKSNVNIPDAFEIAENMYRNYVKQQQTVNGIVKEDVALKIVA